MEPTLSAFEQLFKSNCRILALLRYVPVDVPGLALFLSARILFCLSRRFLIPADCGLTFCDPQSSFRLPSFPGHRLLLFMLASYGIKIVSCRAALV